MANTIINENNLKEFEQYILEGKTIMELAKIYNCNRSTIASAKKKYNLVGISPNSKKRDKESGTKKCLTCEQVLPLDNFYSNGFTPLGHKKYKPRCKSCSNIETRNRKRDLIVEYLFSVDRDYKCEVCGYDRNFAALEFHHLDPEEKDIEISRLSNNISKNKLFSFLAEEVPKCAILCANCHREVHNPNSINYGAA